jgi:hypothetical protein
MSEITELREMRPAPSAAGLEEMRTAARDRFVAGTRSRHARHRWKLPVLAGGLTAAVAASAAAALALAGGPVAVPGQHATAGHTRTVVTAAWTVREDAGGTVTVYLRQYADPAALQRTLQADGINAIVRAIPVTIQTITPPFTRPACMYALTNMAPIAVQRAALTFRGLGLPVVFIIHPAAMPRGSALFLKFIAGLPASFKNDNTGVIGLKPIVLNNDTVPACLPITSMQAATS